MRVNVKMSAFYFYKLTRSVMHYTRENQTRLKLRESDDLDKIFADYHLVGRLKIGFVILLSGRLNSPGGNMG